MKKNILFALLALMLSVVSFTSCTKDQEIAESLTAKSWYGRLYSFTNSTYNGQSIYYNSSYVTLDFNAAFGYITHGTGYWYEETNMHRYYGYNFDWEVKDQEIILRFRNGNMPTTYIRNYRITKRNNAIFDGTMYMNNQQMDFTLNGVEKSNYHYDDNVIWDSYSY